MRPIYITRALAVAATVNGISVDAQVPLGALTLGGSLVVAGVAQLSAQRKVIFTPGAGDNLSAITFTIIGTDDNGIPITEAIVGGNAVAVQSVLDYRTVTSITASAASGAGVTVAVGTNGVGASCPIPVDQYVPTMNIGLAVILRSGTANYTLQYTYDSVFNAYNNQTRETDPMTGAAAGDPSKIIWWSHADFTTKAASADGAQTRPITALRLLTNSGTGELEVQVIQQGTQ